MLLLITHAQDVCRCLIADARIVCSQQDALACRRARLLRVLFAAATVARNKNIQIKFSCHRACSWARILFSQTHFSPLAPAFAPGVLTIACRNDRPHSPSLCSAFALAFAFPFNLNLDECKRLQLSAWRDAYQQA